MLYHQFSKDGFGEVLDTLDIGIESLAFLDSFICTVFVKVESSFFNLYSICKPHYID